MIAQTRKAWVAGLCLVAMAALDSALVNLPLDGKTQGVIKIVAAALGVLVTYRVPNEPKPEITAEHRAE